MRTIAYLIGYYPAINYARPLWNRGREQSCHLGVELSTQQPSVASIGTTMHRSALFLDRDGVINVDRGYIHRPDQFDFVPGIFELARFWTNELRRLIVVVSNQSGIGRGYFNESAYEDLTRWMCERFEAEHTAIARVYHCPYHSLHGVGEYRRDHPWRKPNPGMILQAVSDLDLDPAQSAILGDKIGDIEAGAAAGIGLRILVASCHAEEGEGAPSHEVVTDLSEALALLRSRFALKFPD